MRLALLSVFLLLGLVPGLAGALEDAAHLLAEGHTLHEDHHATSQGVDHEDHEDHEDHDDGSGCEDCGHEGLCHCHGGASLAAAPEPLGLGTTPTLELLSEPPLPVASPRVAVRGLERPPRS